MRSDPLAAVDVSSPVPPRLVERKFSPVMVLESLQKATWLVLPVPSTSDDPQTRESILLDSTTFAAERVRTVFVDPPETEERVTASESVIPPVPASRIIPPVVVPPMVRACILVVARFPAPVRYVALLPDEAEILAVGVPRLTPVNANLALAVV